MAKSEIECKREIKVYVDGAGGSYRTWYVGITADIDERLFGDHGLSRQDALWIYRTASSSLVARRVEQYFLGLGFDGGAGGGTGQATTVYAYRKRPGTNP